MASIRQSVCVVINCRVNSHDSLTILPPNTCSSAGVRRSTTPLAKSPRWFFVALLFSRRPARCISSQCEEHSRDVLPEAMFSASPSPPKECISSDASLTKQSDAILRARPSLWAPAISRTVDSTPDATSSGFPSPATFGQRAACAGRAFPSAFGRQSRRPIWSGKHTSSATGSNGAGVRSTDSDKRGTGNAERGNRGNAEMRMNAGKTWFAFSWDFRVPSSAFRVQKRSAFSRVF